MEAQGMGPGNTRVSEAATCDNQGTTSGSLAISSKFSKTRDTGLYPNQENAIDANKGIKINPRDV